MFNRRIFDVLEKVAGNYSEDSEEFQAIEVAAKGLHFLETRDSNARFRQFLLDWDREPNEYEKRVLEQIENEEIGEPTEEEKAFLEKIFKKWGITASE
jgi:hypothetical protein